MILYLPALFYSVLFGLILWVLSQGESWTAFWMMCLVLLSLHASLKTGRRWIFAVVPSVFVVSSLLLLYLIDSPSQRQIFLFLAATTFYVFLLAHYRLRQSASDETGKGLIIFAVMATAFLFYASTYGFYLNFYVDLWLFMLVYGIGTFAITYPALYLIRDQQAASLSRSYALIISLVMAEISLVINFWPFGYLTTGVVSLIFYHVLWSLTHDYFLNILSQKRILMHIAGSALLISMVLASSRWLPAV